MTRGFLFRLGNLCLHAESNSREKLFVLLLSFLNPAYASEAILNAPSFEWGRSRTFAESNCTNRVALGPC